MSTISRNASKALKAAVTTPFLLALALAAPSASIAPKALAQDDIFGEPIPAITAGGAPSSDTASSDPFADPAPADNSEADIFSSSDDLDFFGDDQSAGETAADAEAGMSSGTTSSGPETTWGEPSPDTSAPATATAKKQPAGDTSESRKSLAGENAKTKKTRKKAASSDTSTGNAEAKSADIFNQRVKAKLGAERHTTDKVHPLAQRFPGNFTVVCEAGCDGENAHVVYTEPKNARGPIIGPESDFKVLPPEVAKNAVECVGGCYAGRQSYGVYAGAEAALSGIANEDNSWMSNEAQPPTAARPAKVITNPNGARWYDRMNEAR